MPSASANSDQPRPAYSSFKTFENLLKGYKEKGVPSRIDSSVLKGMSGAAMSQIRTTLRFLRLMDDDGKVSRSLSALVQSYETTGWRNQLGGILDTAYAEILDGIDLKKATGKMLATAFREKGGMNGEANAKAVRFLLHALGSAGREYSDHITVLYPKRTKKPQTKKDKNNGTKPLEALPAELKDREKDQHGRSIPPGWTVHRYQLRKGAWADIPLPDDLKPFEVTRLAKWLETLPFEE